MKTTMTVAKLYGRCLLLQVGTAAIEVKVMGEAATAAPLRDVLLTALEELGVTVVEAKKGATK